LSSISDKDKEDWKKFTESKDPLKDKENNKDLNFTHAKYSYIDLHGYSLEDANKKIENFIIENFNKGIRNLNIITGKGNRSKNKEDPFKSKDLSILKYSVPNFIYNKPELMKIIIKIDTDSINNPLSGSFEIFLKKK
tara:strand:- start:152 stop:562 length:411 start_codon:yes stop_codon:yes gene_type:complete